jgi:hypothetical protein
MNAVDELGRQYGGDSRLRDTQGLTDNQSVLMRQFLSLLGLDVNDKQELVRREIRVKGEDGETVVYRSKPIISYEGAIRLVDTQLSPFLSNLASFTTLSQDDVYRVTRSFADQISTWLYSHREEYDLDPRDIDSLYKSMADQVFLQLNRSREGNSNLVSQVFGNRTEQYLYRGDMDEEGTPRQTGGQNRSIWNLGGLVGGR